MNPSSYNHSKSKLSIKLLGGTITDHRMMGRMSELKGYHCSKLETQRLHLLSHNPFSYNHSKSKRSIKLLGGTITGHCMIRSMSELKVYPRNDFCWSCLDKKKVEFVHHLIFDCPALLYFRLQFLGMHSFRDLESLWNFALINLQKYVRICCIELERFKFGFMQI